MRAPKQQKNIGNFVRNTFLSAGLGISSLLTGCLPTLKYNGQDVDVHQRDPRVVFDKDYKPAKGNEFELALTDFIAAGTNVSSGSVQTSDLDPIDVTYIITMVK